MSDQYEEVDFPLYPEPQIFSQDLYSMNNFPTFNMDPNLVAYNFQRVAHDPYPNPDFASAHLYDAAPGFAEDSPGMYPAGSPDELRAPHASNLSCASGPSASSSAIGSPYSNHAQVPSAVPEWAGHGLVEVAPTIAGDYGYEYSFGSGVDHDFAFADLNKPIGFVGESPTVSASSSSTPRATFSSSAPATESLLARSDAVNVATTSPPGTSSHGSTPRMAQSSPVRRDSRGDIIFQFNSAHIDSPLSRRASLHSFPGASYSSHGGGGGALGDSTIPVSDAPTLSYMSPHVPSSFFSQSTGHFVPSVSFPGVFTQPNQPEST